MSLYNLNRSNIAIHDSAVNPDDPEGGNLSDVINKGKDMYRKTKDFEGKHDVTGKVDRVSTKTGELIDKYGDTAVDFINNFVPEGYKSIAPTIKNIAKKGTEWISKAAKWIRNRVLRRGKGGRPGLSPATFGKGRVSLGGFPFAALASLLPIIAPIAVKGITGIANKLMNKKKGGKRDKKAIYTSIDGYPAATKVSKALKTLFSGGRVCLTNTNTGGIMIGGSLTDMSDHFTGNKEYTISMDATDDVIGGSYDGNSPGKFKIITIADKIDGRLRQFPLVVRAHKHKILKNAGGVIRLDPQERIGSLRLISQLAAGKNVIATDDVEAEGRGLATVTNATEHDANPASRAAKQTTTDVIEGGKFTVNAGSTLAMPTMVTPQQPIKAGAYEIMSKQPNFSWTDDVIKSMFEAINDYEKRNPTEMRGKTDSAV